MSMPDVVAEIVAEPDGRRRQADEHRRFTSAAADRSCWRSTTSSCRRVSASSPPTRGSATTPTSTSRPTSSARKTPARYLIRMVTEQFTKIINVPNMKDHSASGVTGCLKNIAYGEFSNVARSHYRAQTETLTFIGTLAASSRCDRARCCNIMDGLRGVWHAGPFSTDKRYRFYPKQMKFGTDPVAIDRFLIDVIDDKRKQEGAISVWERDREVLRHDAAVAGRIRTSTASSARPVTSNTRRRLGLGVYDVERRSRTRRSRYEDRDVRRWRWSRAAVGVRPARARRRTRQSAESAAGFTRRQRADLVSQGLALPAPPDRRVGVPDRSTAGASQRSQRRAGDDRAVDGFQRLALPARADARQLREASRRLRRRWPRPRRSRSAWTRS